MTIRAADLRWQSDIVLDEGEIARLRRFGTVRPTRVGEVLFDVGDAPYPLVVVLSGRTEIVDRSDGGEFVIKSSGPGEFDGELGLLTGQAAFAASIVRRQHRPRGGQSAPCAAGWRPGSNRHDSLRL